MDADSGNRHNPLGLRSIPLTVPLTVYLHDKAICGIRLQTPDRMILYVKSLTIVLCPGQRRYHLPPGDTSLPITYRGDTLRMKMEMTYIDVYDGNRFTLHLKLELVGCKTLLDQMVLSAHMKD